jgi:hypothetical protein
VYASAKFKTIVAGPQDSTKPPDPIHRDLAPLVDHDSIVRLRKVSYVNADERFTEKVPRGNARQIGLPYNSTFGRRECPAGGMASTVRVCRNGARVPQFEGEANTIKDIHHQSIRCVSSSH